MSTGGHYIYVRGRGEWNKCPGWNKPCTDTYIYRLALKLAVSGFAWPPAATAPSGGSRGGCVGWQPHAASLFMLQVVKLIPFGFAMILARSQSELGLSD